MLYCGGSLARARKAAGRSDSRQMVRSSRLGWFLFGLILVSWLLVGFQRAAGPAAMVAAPGSSGFRTVVVCPGDTLWDVAVRASSPGDDPRVVVYRIREMNQLASATVYPGDVLRVPR